MTIFRLLHLTDLHSGLAGQGDRLPEVRGRLFRDLEGLRQHIPAWDAILFTGDLVQRGVDYTGIEELVQVVREDVGRDTPLLAVPGNHDLQRPDPKTVDAASLAALKALGETPDDRESWEDLLAHRTERWKIVSDAFLEYERWWEKVRPGSAVRGLLPGDFSTVLEKDGARLGVVGLNTATLQLEGGDYSGKLALHPRQLLAVCGGDPPKWERGVDAAVLLTHHPPSWLAEWNRRDVYESLIAPPGRFALHACGHLHLAEADAYSKGWGQARLIVRGGSLYGEEETPGGRVERIHAYSAIEVDVDTAAGMWRARLFPRVLPRLSAWKFLPDTSFDLDEVATSWTAPERTHRSPLVRGEHPAAPVPDEIRAAVGILTAQRLFWTDGGFDPAYHSCFAGTAAGAARAVRERLQSLDMMEQLGMGAAHPEGFAQRRNEVRFLYGAVRRWSELSKTDILPA